MPDQNPLPSPGADAAITEREVEDIEALSSPRSPVIYEIVSRQGQEEMARPAISLIWSGFAAGMSISFSVLAQALLNLHLPDTPWRTLISSLGYTIGFLMAVLSRQQLFTENTITAVLPVMANLTLDSLWRLARLWGIVLAANLVGTLVAAAFCSFTPVVSPEVYAGMLAVGRHLLGHSWFTMAFGGVTAGFLMAAMVWMMPSAEAARFQVIIVMTYFIALGGFKHIVAGGMEAFLLLLHGDTDVWWLTTGFAAPVLLGNIIGGTALFALIAYAQVMKEL